METIREDFPEGNHALPKPSYCLQDHGSFIGGVSIEQFCAFLRQSSETRGPQTSHLMRDKGLMPAPLPQSPGFLPPWIAP